MCFLKTVVADSIELEIPRVVSSYEFLEHIADGSYSVLCLVRSLTSLAQFACKVVPRAILSNASVAASFEREVRIHQTVSHPNIVHLAEVIYTPRVIFLFLEYCSGGDLIRAVQRFGALDEPQCWRTFYDVLLALDYLHSRRIAHRDVKPENILWNEHGDAKLADFGLAHHMEQDRLLGTPCGSISYCAPEILRGEAYDGRLVDVWSLGIVLCVMAGGRLPWKSANEMEILAQAEKEEFELPMMITESLRNVIRRMMKANPKERPTVPELLMDADVASSGLRFRPRQSLSPWKDPRKQGRMKESPSAGVAMILKGVGASAVRSKVLVRQASMVDTGEEAPLSGRPTFQRRRMLSLQLG
jgi:5'-AMP-activated protein kinase catalytic alpha subunit